MADMWANVSDETHLEDSYNMTRMGLPGESEEISRPERIIMPVLFTIIFAVGLVGNILVMFAVLVGKNRQSTTNIFILNLAVADLLLSIFCTPFNMTLFLLPNWIFGEVMCKLTNFLYYCTMFASIFTMVTMSLDRFLAVVYPIRSMKIRSPTYALIAVLVIWVISIVIAMPYMVLFVVVVSSYNGEIYIGCIDDWQDFSQRALYNTCIFVFGYLIPFLLITFVYLMMLKRLWGSVAPSNTVNDNVKAKKKVTQMVIVVVIVFGLCWLPHHIITMWYHYDTRFPFNTFTYGLRLLAMFLSAFNSCVNPIIYAFMSESFRKGFKKTLTCYRRSNQITTTSAASTQQSNVKNAATVGTSSSENFCFNGQVV
ncbi:galanin receptor 2b-like [Glandiceps talaboti]